MPVRITRRTLLASAGVGIWLAVSGCDGPADDADTEVGPTDGAGRPIRSAAADVVLMLATLQRTRSLQLLAAGLVAQATSPLLPEIESSLSQQSDVLERLLRAADVDPGPAPVPPTPGTDGAHRSAGQDSAERSAGDDASATSGGVPRADRIAALADGLAQDATQDALAEVAGASAANLPTLVALHGQRAAAAVLLRRRLPWPDPTAPTGPAAVATLVALRQAVYALEVAAARSDGDEREGFEEVLGPVRRLTEEVRALAGPAAPAPPLGYAVPLDLGSARRRSALVATTLAAVPAAVLDGSAALAGDLPGVTGSVRVLAEVVPPAHRLGVALEPFPGLRLP
jgi:hypothetical protein